MSVSDDGVRAHMLLRLHHISVFTQSVGSAISQHVPDLGWHPASQAHAPETESCPILLAANLIAAKPTHLSCPPG